jgi:flagellar basal-body rod protein FlgB
MKTGAFSDQTLKLLQKVLDLRADNEKVISSNIANSETPGYAPAKFTFENQLKNAMHKNSFSMQTTHSSHIPLGRGDMESVTGSITREHDTTGIGDQNGVSLDQEMIALSENELLYETAAQLLKKKLSIQKYIISGGQ